MAEQRKLTLEATYCKDWTVQDAIREIIQNAVDTRTEVTFTQNGKYWEIRDRGIGLKLSDFLIGRTSKQDDSEAVGQFGEGIKIGCLVLTREHRAVEIRTGGKIYKFSFQHDKEWGCPLLTIDIEDSLVSTKGTSILVECSTEELDAARKLFLQLNPLPILDSYFWRLNGHRTGMEILGLPGQVYVNGVWVTGIHSLFGYNFHDKGLVNRDRTAVGHGQVVSHVAQALACVTNHDIIKKIITTGAEIIKCDKSHTEFSVEFVPRKNTWLKVIREIYGHKVCLSASHPAVDLRAMEKGYRVLELPWSLAYSLKWTLPKADVVIKERKHIIPLTRLSAEEKKFFLMGKGITDDVAGEVGLDTYPIKLYVDKDDPNEHGYWDRKNGTVGLAYHIVQKQDLGGMLGVIIHELVHANNGHNDNCREFENDLGDVISALGLKVVDLKKSAQKRVGLNYQIKSST